MSHPVHRLQRLRTTPSMRALVNETAVQPGNLIMPVFIREDITTPQEIASLPGVMQHSLQSLDKEINDIRRLGLNAIILFGIPARKDPSGSEAWNPNGIVQQAIAQIKSRHQEMIVIADCCLCEYTDHGHCGILRNGKLDNDATLEKLSRIAATYAHAGADIIAPSGMMDGMVAAIRKGLDDNGFPLTAIMSYAIKYASAFYGPFREAAGSAAHFSGDRKHHQMAPSQRREAFLEAKYDEEEGADILMIKPAAAYLDIIRDVRDHTALPVAAYHVSGEYAMLKAAAKQGIVSEHEAFTEVLTGIKRAGADLIISYYAKEFCKIKNNKGVTSL